MKTDLYDTLGVDKNSSPEVLKKAYRNKAKASHPDKTGGEDDEFKKVNLACEVLSDPERKRLYDSTGATEPSKQNDPEAEVVKLLMDLVEKVPDNFSNLVEAARVSVSRGVASLVLQREAATAKAKKLRKTASRLKSKNNLVQLAFEARAVEHDREAGSCRERMLKALKDYSFEVEEDTNPFAKLPGFNPLWPRGF